MNKIQILSDRVLIEVVETTKTKSGLEIVESDEVQSFKKGTVVAVGIGRQTDHGFTIFPKVSIGNTVLFNYGVELVLEGKKYMLSSDSDIVAILS